MKRSFHFRPHLVVPVIYLGLMILALVGAYQICMHYETEGQSAHQSFIYWILLMLGLTGALNLVVVFRYLLPIERFVANAREIPVVASTAPARTDADEFGEIAAVFNHVAGILSDIEARELFPSIVGKSEAMRSVLAQVHKVAPTDATVLILGESGTGKELVAQTLYEHSKRSSGPLVKLNCAAIPEGLLESELFGHEKGAFTGAHARKRGKVEVASGGTLFLDEIGDMPLDLQVKLLRVLEEKSIVRVGGTKEIPVDVRFVAATNQDLQRKVNDKQFREDLFYRLNVFNIPLPPLKKRYDDIILLARHFASLYGDKKISSEAMDFMSRYSWPGNVRELSNVIERASIVSDDVIRPEHLPPEMGAKITGESLDVVATDGGLDEHLSSAEKRLVEQALRQCNGVQVRAAELLGIKPRSLWHRIRKHQIVVDDFKLQQ